MAISVSIWPPLARPRSTTWCGCAVSSSPHCSSAARGGQLEPALFDRLARHVAAFHEAAEVAQPGDGFGDAAAVMAPVRQNFAQIRERVADAALLAELARIESWAEARFAALAPVFDARLEAGRVRECHGDLHLGNLIVLDGEPRLFDAIEFSAALRWTDVVADIAFLVMDLQARGRMDWPAGSSTPGSSAAATTPACDCCPGT